MSICNQGTGPALTVTQCGSQPIALFVDQECGNALCIGDIGTATFGQRVDIHNSTASYGCRLSVGRGSTENIYFVVNDSDNWITAQQDESAADHAFHVDRRFTTTTCRDDFHISRCGTPQVTVDICGRVGIGNAVPTEKLEVAGVVRVKPSSGDALVRLTDNGVRNWDLKVVDGADYFEILGSTTSTSLVVTGAGNVGIGLTNPTNNKLQVAGNAYISSTLGMGGYIQTNSGNNQGIYIGGGGANITSVSPSAKDIVIQDLDQLRFGPSNWDYNCWAGIKYDAASTDLIIGGPNTSAFTSNSNPPNIGVIFAGVDKVTINNCGGSDCIFVITRSGSTTAGLNLGVCADQTAVIASENSDLRLGKKCTGTFYEYSKICAATGDTYINCDLFLPASISKISLGPLGATGDVHIGSSGLGAPTYCSQDYGAYIAHNAYRQSDGAWKHSRTSTICAALLEIAGGGSSGNTQGFYFSGASNAGTGNITWNQFAALGSGGLTVNCQTIQIKGATTSTGNLKFEAANPYICASSYIIMPGGLYVSGGTAYFSNGTKHRGGVGNDSGAWLCITGGTAGDTSFGGNVGIGTTDPAVSLHIKDSTSVIKLDRNNSSYGPAIQLGRCGSNIWTIKESYQGGNNRDLTFMDCIEYPKVTFQKSGDVGIGT